MGKGITKFKKKTNWVLTVLGLFWCLIGKTAEVFLLTILCLDFGIAVLGGFTKYSRKFSNICMNAFHLLKYSSCLVFGNISHSVAFDDYQKVGDLW